MIRVTFSKDHLAAMWRLEWRVESKNREGRSRQGIRGRQDSEVVQRDDYNGAHRNSES